MFCRFRIHIDKSLKTGIEDFLKKDGYAVWCKVCTACDISQYMYNTCTCNINNNIIVGIISSNSPITVHVI